MIAELIDRVLTKGLIDTASASGQQVNFAVQVIKGTGLWRGNDTCLI